MGFDPEAPAAGKVLRELGPARLRPARARRPPTGRPAAAARRVAAHLRLRPAPARTGGPEPRLPHARRGGRATSAITSSTVRSPDGRPVRGEPSSGSRPTPRSTRRRSTSAVLDLQGLSSVADYFLVCSARSTPQARHDRGGHPRRAAREGRAATPQRGQRGERLAPARLRRRGDARVPRGDARRSTRSIGSGATPRLVSVEG